MLKKFLAVAAGLVLGVAVAAEVELRSDHPDSYVVQKGDTLWDIAGKFLSKPWLWPEIWHANPQVKDPHWIYPGDQLTLVYTDGKPQLVSNRTSDSGAGKPPGNGRLSPRMREEPLDSAVTAVPLAEVRPFLLSTRMLTKEDMKSSPYVVGLEESQLVGNQGQVAYVRGIEDLAPGAQVAIVRPTIVYRDIPERFPWDGVPRTVETREWDSETTRGWRIEHLWKATLGTNHYYERRVDVLGYEVQEIGNAEVLRTGDPSTVLIKYSDREIVKGDLVMITPPPPFDLSFQPHSPKSTPSNMRVIAFSDALATVGPHQVVTLSRGAQDGVANGQVYALYQPNERVRDFVKYPRDDVRTIFPNKKAYVQLPEEYVAHAMVFRTFDKVCYALIMDGVRPVHLLDVARAAE